MTEIIMGWLIPFLTSNPHLAVLLSIMAVSRAVFKPACSLIQIYVDTTPSKTDNETWAKIKESKQFKAVSYAVDFLFSIKLPK